MTLISEFTQKTRPNQKFRYNKRVRGVEISQIFLWLLPMMMFNLLLIARHYGSCFQATPPEHFYEILEDEEAESVI